MTTTASPPTEPPLNFDPDSNRMTMGEHLEELRRRIMYGLVGMAVAAAACFWFRDQLFAVFCRPLTHELLSKNLNPQLFYTELSDGFMVFLKICLICAAVVSAPWMAFQLWQFVAAGLYPKERKYITKYIPLSIGLLVAGVLFVYFIVLPWTIAFFLTFSDGIPLPRETFSPKGTAQSSSVVLPTAPVLDSDPPHPTAGNFWFNAAEGRLKFLAGSKVTDLRVIQFGPSNLLSPHLSLPEYIDLVLTTLLTFGLCFQLPLVVLTLARIGIVEVTTLRTGRRYVYFGLAVLAASMTPGDVITAMLALMVPLILLYELGIFLAVWNMPPAGAE